MLANLLDVEEGMVKQAGESEDGVTIFYDFAAAFPSIEHQFFHAFFQSLGWPEWLLRIIRILYLDNFCFIQFQGRRFEGFAISRGIRHGVSTITSSLCHGNGPGLEAVTQDPTDRPHSCLG